MSLSRLLTLLAIILCSFINFASANENNNDYKDKTDIKNTATATDIKNTATEVVVGFLKSSQETYPYEWEFSHNIPEMLSSLGAKVINIDYNTVANFKAIKEQSMIEANNDVELFEKLNTQKIKEQVEKFLIENKINRIFIPGNYYNLDAEPYSPTRHRQEITKAIVDIVRSNPDIHLLGVCGGLQGIMHSVGIEIVRVNKILKSKHEVEAHLISMPNPHQQNVHLHKLRVVPGSRLAQITSQYITPDNNGWLTLYFPDAHGGVVNNSLENIKKLESLGYKITGFSDDGIIEVIEDSHGNIFFQDHPESLAINGIRGNNQDQEYIKERNFSTLVAIAVINDFLYRK